MSETTPQKPATAPAGRVGLLATCLIDTFRPAAGLASARLLEQAGYDVSVPEQGCCGQPNFNGGDKNGARKMALRTIKVFAGYDYVVVPSASCAAMLRVHYPELFAADSDERAQAEDLARRTWELTQFLHDVAGVNNLPSEFRANIVIHDSCSALRELGVRAQPRALLAQVTGCKEQPLANPDVCCGFGGLFCIKYPDISNRMAQKKIADLLTTKEPVDALVSTDLGCLLHLAGKLHRDGTPVDVWHIAEVLDGQASVVKGESR
jgi:L-lactate dehydrogenase complex protein LldE